MGPKAVQASHWVRRVKPYSLISIIVFSYPGGLKEIMAKDIHKKDPTRVRRREGREGSNDYCY